MCFRVNWKEFLMIRYFGFVSFVIFFFMWILCNCSLYVFDLGNFNDVEEEGWEEVGRGRVSERMCNNNWNNVLFLIIFFFNEFLFGSESEWEV